MQTQVSVEKLTASQIQQMPSIGGTADIAQYMQVLPGVSSTGDQGGQLYIRGGSMIQNLCLLDGMIVYNPFHSIGLYSIFETDVILNADIYTGGFGAEYGGRMSSVMDITTRDGNKRHHSGKVGLNTFGASLILEGPLKRESETSKATISYLVTAKNSYLSKTSDLFYSYIDGGLPFDFLDLYGKLSINSGTGSKINFFGFRFDDQVKGYQRHCRLPLAELRRRHQLHARHRRLRHPRRLRGLLQLHHHPRRRHLRQQVQRNRRLQRHHAVHQLLRHQQAQIRPRHRGLHHRLPVRKQLRQTHLAARALHQPLPLRHLQAQHRPAGCSTPACAYVYYATLGASPASSPASPPSSTPPTTCASSSPAASTARYSSTPAPTTTSSTSSTASSPARPTSTSQDLPRQGCDHLHAEGQTRRHRRRIRPHRAHHPQRRVLLQALRPAAQRQPQQDVRRHRPRLHPRRQPDTSSPSTCARTTSSRKATPRASISAPASTSSASTSGPPTRWATSSAPTKCRPTTPTTTAATPSTC